MPALRMGSDEKVDQPERHIEHDEHLKDQLQSLEDAQAANIAEHEITLKEALRVNWKAVVWSAVISLTIVMEGYDMR
jgi:MFS transporter, SP family, general alpha glucoside:H+ symporter